MYGTIVVRHELYPTALSTILDDGVFAIGLSERAIEDAVVNTVTIEAVQETGVIILRGKKEAVERTANSLKAYGLDSGDE